VSNHVPPLRGPSGSIGDARIIVERLDGPAALAALAPALKAMRPRAGSAIGVVCARAGRSDGEIREAAALAAGLFDRLVLAEDDEEGRRAPGEILDLLTAGALAAGLPSNHLARIPREADAVAGALAIARPGDLVVVLSPDPARVRARLDLIASGARLTRSTGVLAGKPPLRIPTPALGGLA
jgi:UDP-N-acetylmuramyl tripeptide synthase